MREDAPFPVLFPVLGAGWLHGNFAALAGTGIYVEIIIYTMPGLPQPYGTGKQIYESDDIVNYLFDTYGPGKDKVGTYTPCRPGKLRLAYQGHIISHPPSYNAIKLKHHMDNHALRMVANHDS